MKVLFYSTAPIEQRSGIEDLVKGMVPAEDLKIYTTLNSLHHGLTAPDASDAIAILYPGRHFDLLDIVSVQHLLRDKRVILVTPDQETETLALAHQLRPRFLTHVSGDLSTLQEVLGKMRADSV
jgi:hypothetical protein